MHSPFSLPYECHSYHIVYPAFFYCTNFLFLIYFDQFRLFSPAFILKLLNGGSVPNHKTFRPAQLCLPSYAGGLSSIVLVQQQLYAFSASKVFPRCLLLECCLLNAAQVPLYLSQWQKIMQKSSTMGNAACKSLSFKVRHGKTEPV